MKIYSNLLKCMIFIIVALCFASPVASKDSACSDKDPRCHGWAVKGDCKANKRFMAKYCKASCGHCEKDALSNIVTIAEAQTSYLLTLLALLVTGLFLAVVKVYFAGGVCRSKNKLHGKVVIVTGATSGIGYYTALDLAWRGARVILACRNFKKGLKVMKEIQTLSHNPNVEVKKLDLESFKSVRNFAADIIREEERLDILVNNAGILPSWGRVVTPDGNEQCFQTNYLSPFLLTNLLLPKMKQRTDGEKGRIVNVSSFVYKYAKKGLDFVNLQSDKSYGVWSTYKCSKLALMLFTHQLSKQLEGGNVTVNSLHPGNTISSIHERWKISGFYIASILGRPFTFLFMKSPRQAAQTTIHCSVSEEVEGVNGGYFVDCVEMEKDPIATDDGVAKKLWEITERLVKLC